MVEQIIEKCLLNIHPPRSLLVGTDGKYLHVFMRMLPNYIYEPILEQTFYKLIRPTPECIIELHQKLKTNGSGDELQHKL